MARRPNSGYNMEEFMALADERADSQPMKASCALCSWSFTGKAGVAREKAAAHRQKKHPQAVQGRRMHQGKNLKQIHPVALSDEDREFVERERQKRAKMHGLVLE